MKPVALTRRLVLEEPQPVPDGMGGFSASWAALGELWAEVLPGSGREVFAAGVTTSRQAWRITVRGAPHGAPSRPRPDQRLREGSRVFRILSVAERDPQGRFLLCLAQEETPA
jgi:head-tail adaptor